MSYRKPMQIFAFAELTAIILVIIGICYSTDIRASAFDDPDSGIIVIDAGHGGIDGGTNREGFLEKNINLNLALNVKANLQRKGYTVVLTRDRDISLDNCNQSSSSRHKRDMIARVGIINTSNAQIFLSIHVNSLPSDPSEDGSLGIDESCCRLAQMQAVAH